MKVLAIIPARRGSKGIKRKNVADVAGKPLVRWTIEAAICSRLLTRTVVTTDDEEVLQLAWRYGLANVWRPPELYSDKAATLPVLQHVLKHVANWCTQSGTQYDAVMCLQPTTPLRTWHDIDEAIELMIKTGCDSVISFCDVGEAVPERMAEIDEAGIVQWCHKEKRWSPRQLLTPKYIRAGSIYLVRCAVLEAGSLEGDDCRSLIIPEVRHGNIDDPLALEWTQFLLHKMRHRTQGESA